MSPRDERRDAMLKRAAAIRAAGGFEQALKQGTLPRIADVSLSEAVVLGLLRQGVRAFVGVFGHGTTAVGEVLRHYQEAGLVRTYAVRHEIEAAHAAMALRWVCGEKAAVFTSIGPGALQAFSGALAAASDGIGVWHVYGDETTQDEGPNMQQIPRHEQGLFTRLFGTMGDAYSLHTPEAVFSALRRGGSRVDHPWNPGPFFLLLPMNVQARILTGFRLDALPSEARMSVGPAAPGPALEDAADALSKARRILVKLGRGALGAGPEIEALLDRVQGVAVHTPIATGIVPASHPANMGVGGSKGSICGNYAMENADLLLAVGTRFVCQSDSSRTGYPRVERVITVNPDPFTANHYARNTPLVGDAAATLRLLLERLRDHRPPREARSWRRECGARRKEWERFKAERFSHPCLVDPVWGRQVLTQPAAIRVGLDWTRRNDAVAFFDAGDVQANGFQIAQDEAPGRTITETGASYMGFAVSALLASAMATSSYRAVAFSGDGSFMMNPQILIDAVQHRACGTILLLDNRRMAAISGLQRAQYDAEFATSDDVEVDYVKMAEAVSGVQALHGGFSPASLRRALDKAGQYQGLSLIHVPVYFGPNPLGGLGAFGRWNVGSWAENTERLRHDIGL